MSDSPLTIHTIPVPTHMTADEAWVEIAIFGELMEHDPNDPRYMNCRWANVRCVGPTDALDYEIIPIEGDADER